MNEWISVKDSLPQSAFLERQKQLVLVYMPGDGVHPASLNNTLGVEWKVFIDSSTTMYTKGENVTHWMPMPEPPKPEKERSHLNYKTLERINNLNLKIESSLSKIRDITFAMGDALQAVDEMKHLSPENAKNIKHLIKETYEDMIEEIQLEVDQDTDFLNELKESLPRCYWGAQCEKE